MAFYVYMYGTYADDIKKAFGSKDKALIELMFSDAEDVAYYEDIQENNFNVSYAIMDIIYGAPLNNPARYIYGYALIELAKKLGKSLPYLQEIRVGEGTDGIKKFLASDFDIKNVDLVQHLLGCTHPFLIPKIDDFPFIGLISNVDLASIRAIFEKAVIYQAQIDALQQSTSEQDKERGEAYIHIKGMIDNMDYCLAQGLDLMVCYY